jgi:pSer/pThr/pTyr-binding forkhead associated (FHA) protein
MVAADRSYYDRVVAMGGPDVAAIEFPGYCPERRFRLGGREMRIGRRSLSRGLEPEVDLTGPPLDPGVSHLHAVLVADPDGGWSVVDAGSENGTLVNGGPIASNVRVPLHDGDRIAIGAWTVLTIMSGDGRRD